MNENTEQVVKERQKSYGHPFEDFSRSAGMASALGFRFLTPQGELRTLEPQDIAHIQILVKLSREVNCHKDDNYVDIKGYGRAAELVWDRKLTSTS
jgi:hypothetical protein